MDQSSPRADAIIERLGLQPHPDELAQGLELEAKYPGAAERIRRMSR